MTSSPSPMPKSLSVISIHAVAELRHTALLVLQYSAMYFSKSLVLGPVVIHPDLSASVTYSISKSDISGGESFIKSMVYLVVLPYKVSS